MKEAIKGITVTVTTTTGRQVIVNERRTRRENYIHMDAEVLDVGGQLLKQAAEAITKEVSHA